MLSPIQKLGWVGKSIKNCSVIKIDGITNENISIFFWDNDMYAGGNTEYIILFKHFVNRKLVPKTSGP